MLILFVAEIILVFLTSFAKPWKEFAFKSFSSRTKNKYLKPKKRRGDHFDTPPPLFLPS